MEHTEGVVVTPRRGATLAQISVLVDVKSMLCDVIGDVKPRQVHAHLSRSAAELGKRRGEESQESYLVTYYIKAA